MFDFEKPKIEIAEISEDKTYGNFWFICRTVIADSEVLDVHNNFSNIFLNAWD